MTTNVTNYNELIDHLVSTMKPNSPVQDVTNSKKDWDDFWYNSKDKLEEETNNIMVLNYNSIHNKHWKDYNVQNNKKSH